ncbi:hypothetical protein [Mycolicibacterium holsaticum]|uniref:Intersectin-EH binding protein Ibp1 n=1 Tax=Mycolicibacterium holsaticum TaxID=152142 RepID=A0A1E3RYV6_9MYCO|nr:hypothetical protein [Mycolicibacterium holsaticum]ODQ95030.1 hypothetical protein BHQ17_06675 [Mycolicibacterium holsaticum]
MTAPRRTATRVIGLGFAITTLAAPAGATLFAFTAPASSIAACPAGESEDLYSTTCVPDLVPNSSSPYTTIPGNPNMPAIDGIPCGGQSSGSCIGLAEEQQSQTPLVQPHTSMQSSP